MATIQWLAAKFRTQRNRNFKLRSCFSPRLGRERPRFLLQTKFLRRKAKEDSDKLLVVILRDRKQWPNRLVT